MCAERFGFLVSDLAPTAGILVATSWYTSAQLGNVVSDNVTLNHPAVMLSIQCPLAAAKTDNTSF